MKGTKQAMAEAKGNTTFGGKEIGIVVRARPTTSLAAGCASSVTHKSPEGASVHFVLQIC